MNQTGDTLAHDPAWADKAKAADRKREEQQGCGSQAHEDAIKERDQLQAVLGDLLKERGLESMLMQVRAALKATLWLLENRVGKQDVTLSMVRSDHAHAVKLINEALMHLPRPPGHDLTHAMLLKLATPVPPAPPAWYPGAPPGRYTMTSVQMAAHLASSLGVVAVADYPDVEMSVVMIVGEAWP